MALPTSTGTIAVTEEQRDLRDSVREFVRRNVTSDLIRDAVDAKTEELTPIWPLLANEGLLALHLAEQHGGFGATLLETAIVVEELGRAMTPGPFVPTVVVSALVQQAGHTRHLSGLADGTLPAAIALEPGGLRGELDAEGRLRVEGASAPAVGAMVAELVVAPVVTPDGWCWVVLRRDQFELAPPQSSHDLTRRLGVVELDTTIEAADVLAVAPELPSELAATIFAAESSGLADWATWTSAEYARVREQFGRPIGQFQGVKHRTAWMLATSEQARVCAWDAAVAASQDSLADPRERSLAAAVAAAVSVSAAHEVAGDCIDTLGGIGFTWEHDASLYLRRAQTLRLLLGPASRWQQRVAELTLEGVRRTLSVELPDGVEHARTQIREELETARNLPAHEQTGFLAEHGYTAPHLPQPWGKGADAPTQLVIAEELDAAELKPHDMVIGNWVVPTLIEHGNEAQWQRFVDPSLRGELDWCQLFSEPGAGSDLAALRTKAEKVDGGWLVNGQKVWTSNARQADFGILLARTDPNVAKHRGISYFLVDMSSPGIDVRPLRELTGEALFNEVFFDDVFIPDDLLVGQPGDGWRLARTTLANERVALSEGSSLGLAGETLLGIAHAEQPLDTQRLTELGRVLCDAQSGSLFGLRSALRRLGGEQPGAESSIAKLTGVAHLQELWEIAMQWQGVAALYGSHEPGTATWWYLSSRNLSIAGGTTDVQLNIIAERILGLPRDVAPATQGVTA